MKVYVYVATRFDLWEWAQMVHIGLTETGHEPTSKWVMTAESFDGKCNAVTDPAERRRIARWDLDDIRHSNAMLLLVPPLGGTGMWVELGYAYALGKRILCVGPAKSRTIFAELPGIEHYETTGKAIAALETTP